MSQNIIKTSFSAGELAPSIFAHTDLAKYHSGAARMRNFFVDYRSGASTRVGTKRVIQTYTPNDPVRLIKFQSTGGLPFMLEFGHLYMRVMFMGESVLETAFNITAATNTDPVAITAPGEPWVLGDWIFIEGVEGMVELNNRFYYYAGGGSLFDENLVPVDATNYGVYTGGGTASRVYKIASPYESGDLALLKFAQVGNVLYFAHNGYQPRTLTFSGPTSWAFALITVGTALSPPEITTQSSAPAGTGAYYAYVVTSVIFEGDESGPSDPEYVNDVVNNQVTAGTITIGWTPVANAFSYNVYRAQVSVAGQVPDGVAFGYVGSVLGTTFIDTNIEPNYADTPPISNNPFDGNSPGTVAFFQQRIWYGGSNDFPQTLWASKPGGAYQNFDVSAPTQEDDSIEANIVSQQVNTIRSMVSMPGGLLVLTEAGCWQITSGTALATTGAVTPLNIVASPQSFNGANDVAPVVINDSLLYVQAKGSVVRSLNYNLNSAVYTGVDISILSNHLFYNYEILEWAYCEEPFKIVWAIRDDGRLLSLTYVKEQEIWGWSWHDTLGVFRSTASVTENNVDVVYFVVNRYLQGVWAQQIECMPSRTFEYGAEDAWCMDCGVQSALVYPATGMSANVSTGDVVFTADTAIFVAGDVGSVLRMGGGIANITAVNSSIEAEGTWIRDCQRVISDGTPIPVGDGSWSLTPKFDTFYGLNHLNGQMASVFADGGVVEPILVENGQITLPIPVSKVVVGLGFTAQLQTMPLDTGGQDSIQGKDKKLSALNLKVSDTRGLKAGSTFNTLKYIKQLAPTTILDTPTPLATGLQRFIMDPSWNHEGQICLEVTDPVPATVLGVIPEVEIGDTK